jgi:hypothetical protein
MKKNQRIEVAYDHPKPGYTTIMAHYMGMIGTASFSGRVTPREMKFAIKKVKEQIREAYNRKKSTH